LPGAVHLRTVNRTGSLRPSLRAHARARSTRRNLRMDHERSRYPCWREPCKLDSAWAHTSW
jgi:hypothetical protein